MYNSVSSVREAVQPRGVNVQTDRVKKIPERQASTLSDKSGAWPTLTPQRLSLVLTLEAPIAMVKFQIQRKTLKIIRSVTGALLHQSSNKQLKNERKRKKEKIM